MRFWILLVAVALAASACGGDGGGFAGSANIGAADDRTDVDPCGLIADDEISAILGFAVVGEDRDPAGPFVNCSYNTGDVNISVAASDRIILAPGQEDECPQLDIGDESYDCPGRVAFLSKGHHVSVSTISSTTPGQLAEIARIVEANLP